jgi:hypothetical protein
MYLSIYLFSTQLLLGYRIIGVLLTSFVANLATLAIIAVVGSVMSGQELDLKQIRASAFKYWLPAIWINIITGIIVGLSTLFFIIPGIVVSVFYTFTLHALVLRNRRGYDALEYSWRVVKGDWGMVFGLLLINIISQIGIRFLLEFVTQFHPVTVFIQDVGVNVIASLFVVVQVVMFLHFDAFKQSLVTPEKRDDDTVII